MAKNKKTRNARRGNATKAVSERPAVVEANEAAEQGGAAECGVAQGGQCVACEELAARLHESRNSADALSVSVMNQNKQLEAKVARRDAEIRALTLSLLDKRTQLSAINELVLTRQHERNLSANEQARLEALVTQHEQTVRDLTAHIERIRSSSSWKLTAPLRSIVGLARRAFA